MRRARSAAFAAFSLMMTQGCEKQRRMGYDAYPRVGCPIDQLAHDAVTVLPAQRFSDVTADRWGAALGSPAEVLSRFDAELVDAARARGIGRDWIYAAETVERVHARGLAIDPHRLSLDTLVRYPAGTNLRPPPTMKVPPFSVALAAELRQLSIANATRFILLPLDVALEPADSGRVLAVAWIAVVDGELAKTRCAGPGFLYLMKAADSLLLRRLARHWVANAFGLTLEQQRTW